jgi:hypothetical protein
MFAGLVGWAKRSVPTIVVSAGPRREERAFAHPTDWFHGIDPRGCSDVDGAQRDRSGGVPRIRVELGNALKSLISLENLSKHRQLLGIVLPIPNLVTFSRLNGNRESSERLDEAKLI